MSRFEFTAKLQNYNLEHTIIRLEDITGKVYSTMTLEGQVIYGTQYTVHHPITHTTLIEFRHKTLKDAIKCLEDRMQSALIANGI